MKTISTRDNKNYNIQAKNDYYQYPDGTDFIVQDGKMTPVQEPEDPTPSGGGVFKVTVTVDSNDSTKGTSDKSPAEMLEAFNAGQSIIGVVTQFDIANVYYLEALKVRGTLYADFYSLYAGQIMIIRADKSVVFNNINS